MRKKENKTPTYAQSSITFSKHPNFSRKDQIDRKRKIGRGRGGAHMVVNLPSVKGSRSTGPRQRSFPFTITDTRISGLSLVRCLPSWRIACSCQSRHGNNVASHEHRSSSLNTRRTCPLPSLLLWFLRGCSGYSGCNALLSLSLSKRIGCNSEWSSFRRPSFFRFLTRGNVHCSYIVSFD